MSEFHESLTIAEANGMQLNEVEIFVPGRLCILGEHTDWAAQYRSQNESIPCGYTLVCATNHGLYARISRNTTSTLSYVHEKDGASQCAEWALDVDELDRTAKEGGFYSYVAGTAAVILSHPKYIQATAGCASRGVRIHNYRTTLPMKKGLSSSAAVCVLVATAFNTLFSLGLTQEELMEVAFQGEMRTPSRCGRMDQCVVMGPGAVGLMEFTDTCSLRKLTLGRIAAGEHSADGDNSMVGCAGGGLYFIIVDLKSFKDTVVILRELNACFPHAANETQVLVHQYVQSIVHIAADAVTAIERGDVQALAEQMTLAQTAFDTCCRPNCPSQLTSPRLHALMNDQVLRACSLAIKGVGSQGDGSAQILCSSVAHQELALAHVRSAYGMDGFFLNIL